MDIGVNTFGLGRLLRKDFDNTLNRLKKSGVTSIEPIINFNQKHKRPKWIRYIESRRPLFSGIYSIDEAQTIINLIKEKGFKIYSIQLNNIDFDETSIDKLIFFMKKNNVVYGAYSPIESDLNKVKKDKNKYLLISKMFKQNGLHFLIHNHHYELKDNDGDCVMNYILDNDISHAELDIGWVRYAGVDVTQFIMKYHDKIEIIHVKDIAINDKRGLCTELGKGLTPLKEVFSITKNYKNMLYIIDHDDSISGDILKDISNGIAYMNNIFSEI